MLTLTTPITFPPATRMQVTRVSPDSDDGAIYVAVSVKGVATRVYNQAYSLTIRDGLSTGLRVTALPVTWADYVELFSLNTPTGFTDVLAANVGAGIAIRNKAVESALVTLGLLPPGGVA